tara:strand:- start:237 stop:2741 length:2505 start_codon:yes stop_codon:yes gene_type:complete
MAIVGSNIEVYTSLNPLYYSIDRVFETVDDVEVLKKDYEIFKNLDQNLFIDLRNRLLKDVFNLQDNNTLPNDVVSKLNLEESMLKEDKTVDIEKFEKIFYSGNHFIKNYLEEEENTMFLYLDSFESDVALYYKKTQLKEIYDKLKLKEKATPKRACRIRVFSRSSDIKKETLKQTIDVDIQNFKRELERYDSRNPDFKKINKVRIISDYDGNIDYLALNVERMAKVSDKKNYIELVEYANTKLKELFKTELNIIDDRDGRELGKVGFFVFPTLQKPGFIDQKKNVKDFLHLIKYEELKQKLTKTKKTIEKSDIEFQKYVKQLKEKLIKGEVVRQLDDFLRNFYELELYPGINGSDVINVTKDLHDKKFRFKKGAKGYISFNAIEIEMIVKMKQILPTNFIEFQILTRDNIEIGIITLTINYGEKENTIKVEKIKIYEEDEYNEKIKKNKSKRKRKRESKLEEWVNKYNIKDVIQEYKKVFKINNKGESELHGRIGILTRKTRIVKNILQIEAYNIASININKPFYIIPLISFDDKDVANYLQKEDSEKYTIDNEELVNIFTNTEECYKFYLDVSTNHPEKVYDREKYSDKFKEMKIKENVKFIVSKLLQKGKVFRPKIVQGEKPFKGIYKMIGYELSYNNRIRIIKDGNDNENKKGSLEMISGILIQKDKSLLQIDPLTFVEFKASAGSLLDKFPPRFQEITLIKGYGKEDEIQIIKKEYNVDSINYETFNKESNIIRVPIELYISQNPPKDHKDFACEIKKNKLRRSFQKLAVAYKAYKDKPPVGKYISNEVLEKMKLHKKQEEKEEHKEEINISGGGYDETPFFKLKNLLFG